MREKTKTILVDAHENVIMSWLRDTYTFGVLCFTAWFANTQMPPSGWINALVAIIWVLWMLTKSSSICRPITAAQAKDMLEELAKEV
jgi:hypothetical protein